MSKSLNSEKQYFSLEILCDDPAASIKVFDGFQSLVADGLRKLERTFEKGIYRIQVCLFGIVKEQIVELTKNVVIDIDPPNRYSSVLLSGYDSSHEYYTYPAEQISRNVILNSQSQTGIPSSIFIFIRFASIKHKDLLLNERTNLLHGFEIHDENLKLINVLDSQIITQDLNVGYAGVTIGLRPGLYFITYKGTSSHRVIPVQIFAGWQTQVFLMMHKKPLFNSLRILMSGGWTGFYANDFESKAMDQALMKMENRHLSLSADDSRSLAVGKWENPLLGILWCYTYIIDEKFDQEELFSTIVRNLTTKILFQNELADLTAIFLLRRGSGRMNLSILQQSGIPLFRVGFREFVNASYSSPDIIPVGSIMSFLAPKLCSDTVFTTFEFTYPSPMDVLNLERGLSVLNKSRNFFMGYWLMVSGRKVKEFDGFYKLFIEDIDYFDRNDKSLDLPFGILYDVKASWEMTSVISSIYNRLESGSESDKITIEDVAQDVSLPFVNTYEIIQTLVAIDKNNSIASIKSLNDRIQISESTIHKMYELVDQKFPM